MRAFDKLDDLLETRLRDPARALILAAALLLIPSYVAPLWNLTMFAPQYQEGLRLDIYSYKLKGGNRGQDVKEINVLNHYIGMKDLVEEDFTEFKWMPFVMGAIGLLMLRAAVFGKLANLIDVLALFGYFGAFSLWSFAYKLYAYGHNLSPAAAMKVAPFMPPLFGSARMANFEIYSYPRIATYAVVVSVLALVVAAGVTLRRKPAAG
jgi:copper chaperone NosL